MFRAEWGKSQASDSCPLPRSFLVGAGEVSRCKLKGNWQICKIVRDAPSRFSIAQYCKLQFAIPKLLLRYYVGPLANQARPASGPGSADAKSGFAGANQRERGEKRLLASAWAGDAYAATRIAQSLRFHPIMFFENMAGTCFRWLNAETARMLVGIG